MSLVVGARRALLSRRPVAAAPAGGFRADSISGCVLWHDASRITPQSDNTDLTQWNDETTGARHATQGTGSLQPNYRTGVANGQPGVLGDGTDDYLEGTSPFGDINFKTQAFTIAFAMKFATATSYQVVVHYGCATGTNYIVSALYAPVNDDLGLLWHRADDNATASVFIKIESVSPYIADGTTHIVVMTYDGSGTPGTGNCKVWIDGVDRATVANTGVFDAVQSNVYRLLKDGTYACGSHLLEHATYNVVLSTGNRDTLEAEWGSKYAVSVS